MKSITPLAVLIMICCVACGDDESPRQNMTPRQMDDNNPDPMTQMPPDQCVPKTTCDANVCGQVDDGCGGTLDCGQPLTECPAGACGQVDDGCGGALSCGEAKTCESLGCGVHDNGCGEQIDCGACLCEDNRPAVDRCGPCGFGKPRCKTPGGTCSTDTLTPLAAFDEQACTSRILYVDAGATAGGDGSASNPYKNYEDAVKKATPGDVLILANNNTFEQPIEIKDGVHVLGGFKHHLGTWTHDPDKRTRIELKRYTTGIAMQARDITTPTYVVSLIVQGADATAGKSTIGLLAERASGLVVQDVRVFSGNAGDGIDGVNGADGDDGPDGKKGNPGRKGSHNVFFTTTARPAGGQPGRNTKCPDSDGGFGAMGTGKHLSGLVRFEHGEDAAKVSGMEGKGGQTLLQPILYPTDDRTRPESGAQGFRGQNGMHGNNGIAVVKWDNGLVITGDGKDGVDGAHGGGGGGGGAHAVFTYYNLYLDGDPKLIWSWSPTGGGGGAGGCGGLAGTAGTVGGGAFGAIIVDGNPTLIDFYATAQDGGDGGEGGLGGDGGRGGSGGSGNIIAELYDGIIGGLKPGQNRPGRGDKVITTFITRAGDGGHGGYGGRGGDGGIGGGGPSIGIWCVRATPSQTGTVATHQHPGRGWGSISGEAEYQKGCKR